MTADFCGWPRFLLDGGGYVGRILFSKPVWPRRVAALLTEVAAEASRPLVLHGLSNINLAPREKGRGENLRRVLTVHDVIPLLAPEAVSKAYALQFRWLLPQAVAAADKIICVSGWTERTLCERVPGARGKTVVVRNGADAGAQPEESAGSSERELLLSVGRDERYKRLDVYIAMVRQLATSRPGRFRAVLVTDQKGKARFDDQAKDLVEAGHLELRSGLSEEALTMLYRSASVYVQPSLFEGFCLPAAFAARAGTPVVYVAGTALDETIGPSLGTPLAAEAAPGVWAEAVEAASAQGKTAEFRENTSAARAAIPTWDRTAQGVAAVYNSLT